MFLVLIINLDLEYKYQLISKLKVNRYKKDLPNSFSFYIRL